MSTFTWKCPKCGHENAVGITNSSMLNSLSASNAALVQELHELKLKGYTK